MPTPLVVLVAEAHTAGVRIGRGVTGRLTLKAPGAASAQARRLRARDADVLQLFDWRQAAMGEPLACVLCHRPALLRDPVDRRPCHKVCVDRLLWSPRTQRHSNTTETPRRTESVSPMTTNGVTQGR